MGVYSQSPAGQSPRSRTPDWFLVGAPSWLWTASTTASASCVLTRPFPVCAESEHSCALLSFLFSWDGMLLLTLRDPTCLPKSLLQV
jgi:hypothetical protein